MSTVIVDTIQEAVNTFNPYQATKGIPVYELRHMTVKTARQTYTSGTWVPSTAYAWMPGGYFDYTPLRGDTQIRFSINLAYGWVNGHCITHNVFYAAGSERGRHSISGHHLEQRHLYLWQVASWGAGNNQRIGYQSRNYGGSNQGRFHGTGYHDGGGSTVTAQTELYIEEILVIP